MAWVIMLRLVRSIQGSRPTPKLAMPRPSVHPGSVAPLTTCSDANCAGAGRTIALLPEDVLGPLKTVAAPCLVLKRLTALKLR
jgi:hypothetical protein